MRLCSGFFGISGPEGLRGVFGESVFESASHNDCGSSFSSHSGTFTPKAESHPRRDQAFYQNPSSGQRTLENKGKRASVNPLSRFANTAEFFTKIPGLKRRAWAPPTGRQLYFTFPSAPDPLFRASKAPFLTLSCNPVRGTPSSTA